MTAYTGQNGFELIGEQFSTSNLLERLPSVASTQYNKNDALYLSASGSLGLLSQVTATVKCTHVYVNMFTSTPLLRPAAADLSTTLNEQILAVRCAGTGMNFKTNLVNNAVPYRNNIACNSNSTLNTIVFTDAGSTGDILGGQIYVTTLQQQFTILTDTVSTGVRTVTVAPLPSRAVTTGDSIIAVGWSAGATGIQFNATSPPQAISNTVAGKTGGNINIIQVVLGPTLPTAGGAFISGTNTVPYAVVAFPVVP
jgi:hypothetical protein